jgi:hypothetical protein
MQISLKSIIREAFKTAYEQYKSSILESYSWSGLINERTAKEMGDALNQMSPKLKTDADKVIQILDQQLPGWEKYHWDPSGKEGKLNWKQWDYIVETLFERALATKDLKYGKIFSVIYNILPTRKSDKDGNSISVNSPVVNNLLKVSNRMNMYYKNNPQEYLSIL